MNIPTKSSNDDIINILFIIFAFIFFPIIYINNSNTMNIINEKKNVIIFFELLLIIFAEIIPLIIPNGTINKGFKYLLNIINNNTEIIKSKVFILPEIIEYKNISVIYFLFILSILYIF